MRTVRRMPQCCKGAVNLLATAQTLQSPVCQRSNHGSASIVASVHRQQASSHLCFSFILLCLFVGAATRISVREVGYTELCWHQSRCGWIWCRWQCQFETHNHQGLGVVCLRCADGWRCRHGGALTAATIVQLCC